MIFLEHLIFIDVYIHVCFIYFIRLVQRPWVVYYKMDLCQKSKRKCYLIIHKESSYTLRKMPKNKQNNSLHILLLCQFTICQQKYESTFLTIIKSWWRKNVFCHSVIDIECRKGILWLCFTWTALVKNVPASPTRFFMPSILSYICVGDTTATN